MSGDVFISYSSSDKAVADALCASIEQQGLRVWIAPRDILPGKGYGGAIIEAINSIPLMIVILSSSSNGSHQVLREVERAASKGVPIIPFRIENIAPTDSMEYFLSSQHWMDAFSPPIEQHVEKLTRAVVQFLGTRAAIDKSANADRRAVEAADAAVSSKAPVQSSQGSPFGGNTKQIGRTNRLIISVAVAASILIVSVAGLVWFTRAPALVGVDATAIAVLPFRNLSQDPAVDYLSLAIPAELDSLLSRTTSVTVRPLESVKHYKDQNWTGPDIEKSLHVGTVIGGSFWRADQQLRVSVDIIDAHQNRQLWSEPFQFALSDLLNLLDGLIRKVAGALRLHMQPAPGDNFLGTANTEVYHLYLRSLSLEQEITDENNNSAIRLLKQAVNLDPGFARGQAALAEAYVTRFWWNFSNDPMWLDLAEAASREALKLDPGLPEAHVALGRAFESKGKRREAMSEYFASVVSAANFLRGLENVARFAFYMGDFDRALATLNRIASIDPTNNVHIRKAMCFYFSGRLDESRRENQAAEKRAQGVDQLTLIAFSYVWLKDLDAAERMLQRLQREQPEALSILEIRAWLYTARGQVPEARKQMQELIAKRSTFGIMDEIATFYAIQGDSEQAIEWLTKAVQMGAPNYAWYNSDFFKLLRGDPRYQAILKELSDEYASVRP